jgi:prepilin-type N-terminal cleavage/methylation domain-containing protein
MDLQTQERGTAMIQQTHQSRGGQREAVRLRRGFTLLEMILGLTLLALFSVAVTSIMSATLRTTFLARNSQMETDQVNRFVLLCRHTFQNLPSTAILSLKIIETGTPIQQELTISGVPETFAFGTNPMSYKDSILGLRPDLEATEDTANAMGERIYNIALSREDIIPHDPTQANVISSAIGEGLAAPDDQGRVWMPLLASVTSLTWRFLDTQDDTLWKEEWDSTDLPPLVEMNLLLKGRTLPIRTVFALPTTKLAGANPSLAPKTSTQGSSSGSNSQQVGGGGGGGGNDRGGGDRGGGDRGRGGDSRGGGQGGGRGGPGGPGGPGGGPGGPGGPQGGGRPGGGGGGPSGGFSPGGGGGGSQGGAAPGSSGR